MQGGNMLEYVTLILTALQRQPELVEAFIQYLTQPSKDWQFLEPKEWYHIPHNSNGNFIWMPHPCLGDVAVYLLAESHHICPWNLHILVIPSIMAGCYQKMLYKTADFVCTLPFGNELWPKETEYEPLTMAFVFPSLSRAPWRIRCTDIRGQ
ncbi:hypothetical protein ACA910_009407 [Epithemia clementina (nom. ined.)]